MGFFARLLGKGNARNTGLPFKYEYNCERCGVGLHSGTGGKAVNLATPGAFEGMFNRAIRCTSCSKIFCGKCSIEVEAELGKPDGARDFTCPFCRTTGISAW